MTAYELLLFGHLLFVVTWIGTNICLQVLSLRAMKSSGERKVAFLSDVEWIGTRLLIPASLLVIVFGVLLVGEAGYELSDAWVTLGFVGFGFSFVVGSTFLGPESGRIASLAEERGAEDPEVGRRINRVLLVSRIELLILIAVILDMVVKPTF